MRNTAEKPAVSERALSIYTMNRAYWESRFYDENYWARYLDLLAQNRFKSLVVIFGYENGGFLAPCYPYFFDVPEFPGLLGDRRDQVWVAVTQRGDGDAAGEIEEFAAVGSVQIAAFAPLGGDVPPGVGWHNW